MHDTITDEQLKAIAVLHTHLNLLRFEPDDSVSGRDVMFTQPEIENIKAALTELDSLVGYKYRLYDIATQSDCDPKDPTCEPDLIYWSYKTWGVEWGMDVPYSWIEKHRADSGKGSAE